MSLIKRIWHKIRGEKPLTIYEQSDLLIERMRAGGAKIGENVTILDSKIDMGDLSLIEIGNDVLITGARLLTHDASMIKKTHYYKVGKVKIGNNVFVSVDSIILCGKSIGNNVIVGAGCVVSKDIPDNSVVGGNPMKMICTYQEFIEKHNTAKNNKPVIKQSEITQDCQFYKDVKESVFGYVEK